MDIQYIVKNPDVVKANYAKRGVEPELVDKFIDIYNQWVVLSFNLDQYRRLQKDISKSIPKKKNQTITNVTPDNVEQLYNVILAKCKHKKTYSECSTALQQLSYLQLLELCTKLKEMIAKTKKSADNLYNGLCDGTVIKVYNMVHDTVPEYVDKVIHERVVINDFPSDMLPHHELCEKTGIIDTKKGHGIAGHRGYFFKGLGVRLNRALISYALDFLEKKGFTLMETPHMMLDSALEGVTQLSEFRDTLYKADDKYLVATSEQPLTALFRKEIVSYKNFPIKYCGLSHCYRKEAGSSGRDMRGIFRVHQFEKVEQFVVTSAEESWKMMDEMIHTVMDFYESLGLYFRVVNVHARDLNDAAAMKYDLEGYFPGCDEKYRELVSCTNCTDYISRKINCKDDKHDYVHMLNSTLCANTRTICCILETYQTEDGVMIPPVLVPYMGGVTKIPFE